MDKFSHIWLNKRYFAANLWDKYNNLAANHNICCQNYKIMTDLAANIRWVARTYTIDHKKLEEMQRTINALIDEKKLCFLDRH